MHVPLASYVSCWTQNFGLLQVIPNYSFTIGTITKKMYDYANCHFILAEIRKIFNFGDDGKPDSFNLSGKSILCIVHKSIWLNVRF